MLVLLRLVRLARPLYLLLAALGYVLGAGVARYLAISLEGHLFWAGLFVILLVQISMSLLAEAFRPFPEPLVPGETLAERRIQREAALYVSVAALAACGMIATLLYTSGRLQPLAILFMGLSLAVILAYAVPPLRLLNRGFGELLLVVQMVYLAPSTAFVLQSGESHRLLNLAVLPLTFLALAALIALAFPAYAEDLKYERGTLLTRLGWERVLPLHHALVLGAYAIYAGAPLLGFSFRLLGPALLSLPFGVAQVLLLRGIAAGGRPLWKLLTTNAMALVGLTTYFLIMSFWMR